MLKTSLTAEESAKLIELGVSPERASMCLLNLDYDSEVIPCEDVWEENGRFLANVNDEVIDVDRKIVTKDSDFDHSYANDNPIFTLGDILDILPKKVKIHRDGDTLSMIYHCGQWRVGYSNCAEYCNHTKVAPELIDALDSLLLWCLEKGCMKLN